MIFEILCIIKIQFLKTKLGLAFRGEIHSQNIKVIRPKKRVRSETTMVLACNTVMLCMSNRIMKVAVETTHIKTTVLRVHRSKAEKMQALLFFGNKIFQTINI